MGDLSTTPHHTGVATKVGPQSPHAGTPARRPLSVRRTTTHTCLRPDGLLGEVRVVACGRDLWTGPSGDGDELGEARIEAAVDFVNGRLVKSMLVRPSQPPLERLVGLAASGGFRKALDETMPQDERGGSLTYQLLDDLPTALLVSGVALASAGMYPSRSNFATMQSRADICAGWASGATIMVEGERLGHPPIVVGPVAPSLDSSESDPLAWHASEPMTSYSTKRCRRIDVWTEGNDERLGERVAVEAFFRDSQADGDGVETVVHEYLVSAELRPGTLEFVSCDAEIGVLPWVECPAAAASASRVVGTTPGDLRDRVRRTFVGTTTCTHLNDTLRALACLDYLAGALAERGEVRK